MLRIAAEVGFSETAFIAPANGDERTVRYFSPEQEVSFCGHATIAAGAVMGAPGGEATYRLSTAAGIVPVTVRSSGQSAEVSLTSVDTKQKPVSAELLDEVLELLCWTKEELDPAIPPVCAFAGAWHLVIAVATEHRLANLDYDFEGLKSLMQKEDLTTLQLIWRDSASLFHSRNPFPVGGVVEDPATGAAAAALGGYLRDAGLIKVPARFVIRQGETMGRPSVLAVEVSEIGGIVVSGSARNMQDA